MPDGTVVKFYLFWRLFMLFLAYLWPIFGISAVIFAILNAVFALKGKRISKIFMFASLSFTALTICSFYSLANNWVVKNDWTALLDVTPSTHKAVWIFTGLSILVNSLGMIHIYKILTVTLLLLTLTACSNVSNNDVNTSFDGQSESKENSVKVYEVSGSFTATVEDLLPDYGVDDSIGWAVVHEFQGPSYLLHVRYLDTDSMEIGKTYVFDVVPIPVVLNGLTLPDNSLARGSLSGFREAKEGETGLNSLSLNYKEITLPSEKTEGRSIDDDVTTTVSGSFTASLKKLLPYYGVDDRNCLAVVFEFQGQPFLINLMNIDTDSLELDKTYVFTVEPKTFDGYIYHTNEIVQYLNIVDCRPAEGNESGLESLQLEIDEIIGK